MTKSLEKLIIFKGYLALIIITTVACWFAMVRGLVFIIDYTSKFILTVTAIPFMIIAFLLEPQITKSSVEDLIKIRDHTPITKKK